MAEEVPGESAPSMSALVSAFLVIYVVWGSTYLAIKFAVETLPPFLLAAGRFLIAGSILYTILRLRGSARPTRAQWRPAILTGALLLLGGNGLVTWGQQTVPSGIAALIITTTPLWMALFAWVFYGGERPLLRVWLGIFVGFCGAALLVYRSSNGEHGTVAGFLSLLAAPLTWSIGSLETRRNPPTSDALMTSAMQMLAGGAMMLVTGSLLGEWPRLLQQEISTKSLLAFTYLTLVGGLIGYTTYAWLLRNASPNAISTYAYVNPLVAVLLGWLLGGETLGLHVWVAAVLVIGAVVLITLPKSSSSKSESRSNMTVCNAGQARGLSYERSAIRCDE